MAAIQSKKFGWVRTATARESMDAWREKLKAMREDFESRQSAARDAFAAAWSTQISDSGNIYAEMALKRTQEEIQAKLARNQELAKYDTSIDTAKADTKDSIFADGKTGELDSGTKIDLTGGTLTLSDGTVIDIATGVKKVDLTA
ncbi:MAG: hypothetical protein K8H87_11915 [Pseudorhodoplanes sp.]|nr:MAG: hypothetical protein F9K38_03525 [Pseudorhodoplanes sp.]MBZ0140461.1 hypothetical protein [Pseudorhodoplanes sp.]